MPRANRLASTRVDGSGVGYSQSSMDDSSPQLTPAPTNNFDPLLLLTVIVAAWFPMLIYSSSMWYTETMNNPAPIAMTPEQLAAVQAGQGIAHVQDPNNQRVYVLIEQGLIEQGQQPTLSDDYFREKLAEGLAESERGASKPWRVNELKDDLRRRYAAKHPQS